MYGNYSFTKGVDFWAVGVVLYELAFGSHPFTPSTFCTECTAAQVNALFLQWSGRVQAEREVASSLFLILQSHHSTLYR